MQSSRNSQEAGQKDKGQMMLPAVPSFLQLKLWYSFDINLGGLLPKLWGELVNENFIEWCGLWTSQSQWKLD